MYVGERTSGDSQLIVARAKPKTFWSADRIQHALEGKAWNRQQTKFNHIKGKVVRALEKNGSSSHKVTDTALSVKVSESLLRLRWLGGSAPQEFTVLVPLALHRSCLASNVFKRTFALERISEQYFVQLSTLVSEHF